MRLPLAAAALLLIASYEGCVRYEYEHEFWLRVDGSGTVYVTARPVLWAAFKGVGQTDEPDKTVSRDEVRRLFERSGLKVRRVRKTRHAGRTYLFVAADFDDVNQLGGTPAFPDLRLRLGREGERLRLEGAWIPPPRLRPCAERDQAGLMAVRFHLPSKVYEHENAFGGVERGNIVGWRQSVRLGFAGQRMDFGALMDQRSILMVTVEVFAGAILAGVVLIGGAVYLVYRRGRRLLEEESRLAREPRDC
jgi:hypothetical protein